MITLEIDELNQGIRLDTFISDLDELELSRSYVKTLIEKKHILVNDKSQKAGYKLKSSDLISIDLPKPEPLNIEAQDIPLDIVFEDDELMVINKPINMVTHPAPGLYSGTLVNAIMFHVEKTGSKLSDINGVLRPGIVHRLDKDTSGLLVVAKSNLAHRSLAEQIQSRSCSRVYTALVHENIKEENGTVDRAIGRHPKDRKKMTSFDSVNDSPNARAARTHYKVLNRFNFKDQAFTLVECKLDTGRTHQIRVHMSWMKRPIVGDLSYSAPKNPSIKADRPMLHSTEIAFKHPISEENLEFSCPVPQDFQIVLDKLRTN